MNKSNKILILIIILLVATLVIITTLYIKEINMNNTFENQLIQNGINNAENINNDRKVYSIKDKNSFLYEENLYDREYEHRGIKLLEYDNSKTDYAEIYFVFYDYTTEPGIGYECSITDEANKTLLLNGNYSENCIGGVIDAIQIKKIDLNQKIKFTLNEYERDNYNVIKSKTIEINLLKDLDEKVKISQNESFVDFQLADIKFKYFQSENEQLNPVTHAYSEKYIGEILSSSIKVQYGNYFPTEEHINVEYIKNMNNLTLEEAFESLKLIEETFGQYGLSDNYGINVCGKDGDILETVEISFEEIIKLCNGLIIEKNGKQYSKETFGATGTIERKKIEELEIGNGINAIKYQFGQNDTQVYYMFIYNDNIYYITLPTMERCAEEVQQILNSFEINTVN